MSTDSANCGAVAYSRTGDPKLGDFDEAVMIQTFGEVDGSIT